jgi:hypothetical protein
MEYMEYTMYDYDKILRQHQDMALEVLKWGGANILPIHDMDSGLHEYEVLVSYKITRAGFRSSVAISIHEVLCALANSHHSIEMMQIILSPARKGHNELVERFLTSIKQQKAIEQLIENHEQPPNDVLF